MSTPTERVIHMEIGRRIVHVGDGLWRQEWWHCEPGEWLVYPPGVANSGPVDVLQPEILPALDAAFDAIDVAYLNRRAAEIKRAERKRFAQVAVAILTAGCALAGIAYAVLR